MTTTERAQRAPPKRSASVPLGRPIERLRPIDRDRIRADAAAFLAYARRNRRPPLRNKQADAWRELTAADLEGDES